MTVWMNPGPAVGLMGALMSGTAYAGGVITRYYDSLLTKVTAWAPTPEKAIARMDRALREFRVRGVSTNIDFVINLLKHPTFLDDTYTTKFIDTTPELFAAVKRQTDILAAEFSVEEFLEQLEAEHRIKPEVREQRGIGFVH